VEKLGRAQPRKESGKEEKSSPSRGIRRECSPQGKKMKETEKRGKRPLLLPGKEARPRKRKREVPSSSIKKKDEKKKRGGAVSFLCFGEKNGSPISGKDGGGGSLRIEETRGRSEEAYPLLLKKTLSRNSAEGEGKEYYSLGGTRGKVVISYWGAVSRKTLLLRGSPTLLAKVFLYRGNCWERRERKKKVLSLQKERRFALRLLDYWQERREGIGEWTKGFFSGKKNRRRRACCRKKGSQMAAKGGKGHERRTCLQEAISPGGKKGGLRMLEEGGSGRLGGLRAREGGKSSRISKEVDAEGRRFSLKRSQ